MTGHDVERAETTGLWVPASEVEPGERWLLRALHLLTVLAGAGVLLLIGAGVGLIGSGVLLLAMLALSGVIPLGISLTVLLAAATGFLVWAVGQLARGGEK